MDKRGVALESDKSQESVTSPSRQSSPSGVQGSSLSILVRLRRNCNTRYLKLLWFFHLFCHDS
jgi:hypothetical protein